MRTIEMQTTEDSRYDENDDRLLADAQAEQIIDRVISLCGKKDVLKVRVHSVWYGAQRWARNRAFLTSNVRTLSVNILRFKESSGVTGVHLNQVDDESLRAACAYVENNMAELNRSGFTADMDLPLGHPTWEAKGIPVWSDRSYNHTAPEKARAVYDMIERAESNGMLSAGSFETIGHRIMYNLRDEWGRESVEVGQATMAQCSTTVRHPKGTGSGWAGASSFELNRLDLAKLGETAFDKCIRSIDPVRIEPGRYQTILEPQAVASFATYLVKKMMRGEQEAPGNPFYLGYDQSIELFRSKMGLPIVDRRLSITHDPEDPVTGTHPVPGMRLIEIIKDGVLKSMFTDYDYTLGQQNRTDFDAERSSFVMRGNETTTTEEMISNMKRGLLLTRISELIPMDMSSMLCTGLTRDGLWLIENGKITKAVRNFRWTESPLFVFNNVESIGESVPIMSPKRYLFGGLSQDAVTNVVVPTLKVNDFSFTSTIDAI